MIKKILFFFCLILSSTFLSAQNIHIEMPPGYNRIMPTNEYVSGREGSPFLNKDWKPGILTLWSGKIIKGLSYRYDALNNEMQYLINQQPWIIGAPDSIEQLSFDDRTFIYHDFSDQPEGEKGYYEVLVKGGSVLLARHYIEIIRANYNMAMSTGSKNDKLVPREKYYLVKDGKITLIDRKGKNIFLDKKPEIDTYVKKMDLSFKKKDDLVKIVEYYNSLDQ